MNIIYLFCYFFKGGLRAVVWTDTLQSLLMFASMVAILILGAEKVGGWEQVWINNQKGQRLEFFKCDQ